MNYWASNGTVTNQNLPKTPELYETSMVGNASIDYLTDIIYNESYTNPFLIWIGVHAPHYPADPAAWYTDLYPNETAPRTPNFNVHTADHHDFVSTNPELDENAIGWIDQLWKDRLRSLMSVDDLMYDLIQLLNETGIINNTYIIFSSDHGYHLGQWRLPCSKQNMYETDIRIPTFITGPNIDGNLSTKIVSNVDFLPTMLDLAEIEYDMNTYDGMSWVQGGIVKPYSDNTMDKYGNITQWRDTLLVQYGAGNDIDFSHCQTWVGDSYENGTDKNPPCCDVNGAAWMINDHITNNWRLVRIINDTMDVVYSEFVTNYDNKSLINNPSFFEYYDLEVDPYQIDNLYGSLNQSMRDIWHDLLVRYALCAGTACW